MRKKTVLFPYNVHSCEILRYKEMLDKYEIVGILAPKGWGLGGRDAGFVDGGTDTGISIQDSLNDDKIFDAILVTADCTNPDMEQIIYDHVKELLHYGKELVFASEVSERIQDMCKGADQPVLFVAEQTNEAKKASKIIRHDTPIVLVAGMHELTHKFKIQMELHKYFKEKGYKVSHIASKQFATLFGAHTFPQFMFSEIKEECKIFGFNQYVRQIEKEEQPDVIIIGIPGGMMPYSEKFPGYFGITMFEVMQAVRPDFFAVCCLYEKYNKVYFEKLSSSIMHKYGIPVDCFNISTFQVDYNESEQNDSLQYFKVTYREAEEVATSCSAVDVPVFNVMNDADGSKIAELALRKLQEYSEAEPV